MKRRRQRGNYIFEAAIWILPLTMLIVFLIQLGKITYTYYAIKNSLYTTAQYLASQQGTNFCDLTDDVNAQTAIELGVTGTPDGSAPPLINNLTADMLQINFTCVDPASGQMTNCDTSGCGGLGSGPSPAYINVGIPSGYTITPRMLFVTLQPIVFQPQVTVPFGGTAL